MVCTCLKSRPFLVEMACQMDLNGLMKLKEGGFKQRYKTGSQHCVTPNGFVHRLAPSCHIPDKVTKKMAKPKIVPNSENESAAAATPEIAPKRQYHLNKKKVRSRIIVYTDMMRRSRVWKQKELYFWTISFPPCVTDDIGYQLLNNWLTKLRQRNKYRDPLLDSYLWVAERQQNGTLHFHLLIPHRMPVKVANRDMMVSLCTMVKNKTLNWNLHAARRYNGVDIAKDRKTRKVINFLEKKRSRTLHRYLTKYVTKNNTAMTRLCWNSSVDWSVPFSAVRLTWDELLTVVPSNIVLRNDKLYENDWVLWKPWLNDPPLNFVRHLATINGLIVRDYFKKINKKPEFLN
jgi:hypothetical protein